VRLPGRRPAKLDNHTASGIFLGYTATDHNVYYRDTQTGKIKIATHVTFDEAGFTVPKAMLSPAIAQLQSLGSKDDWQQEKINGESQKPTPVEELQVVLLSDRGTIPSRATPESAGYDLHSAEDIAVPPGGTALIATDISFKLPPGTYGQIMSRSGLSVKNNIDVRAGTIDADFQGNVRVHLANTSQQKFLVKQGD